MKALALRFGPQVLAVPPRCTCGAQLSRWLYNSWGYKDPETGVVFGPLLDFDMTDEDRPAFRYCLFLRESARRLFALNGIFAGSGPDAEAAFKDMHGWWTRGVDPQCVTYHDIVSPSGRVLLRGHHGD